MGGAALAVWVLEPAVVAAQHVMPQSPAQWAAVAAVIGAVGAVMGLVAAGVAGPLVALWDAITPSPVRDRRWAATLASVPLLIPVWLGVAHVLQLVRIGHAEPPGEVTIIWAVLLLATLGPAAMWLYDRVVRLHPQPSLWMASRFAVMTLVAGALLPALRTDPGTVVHADTIPPALGYTTARAAAPLVVAALTNADLPLTERLLRRGRLPTVAQLIARGTHGPLGVASPQSPATEWATFVTGVLPDEHGWHGELAVDAWGFPSFEALRPQSPLWPLYAVQELLAAYDLIRVGPPARAALQQRPVWEHLAQAHVDSTVMRFPFNSSPHSAETPRATFATAARRMQNRPAPRAMFISSSVPAEQRPAHTIYAFDRALGRYLARYHHAPNVLLLITGGHRTAAFVLAGPEVPSRIEPTALGRLDVAPTILDLAGLNPPPDMRGWSLRRRLATDAVTLAAASALR